MGRGKNSHLHILSYCSNLIVVELSIARRAMHQEDFSNVQHSQAFDVVEAELLSFREESHHFILSVCNERSGDYVSVSYTREIMLMM